MSEDLMVLAKHYLEEFVGGQLDESTSDSQIIEAVVSLNVLTDSMNALIGLNEDWGRDPQGGRYTGQNKFPPKLYIHKRTNDKGETEHYIEQFRTLKGVKGHPVLASVFRGAGRVVGKPVPEKFRHLIPKEGD